MKTITKTTGINRITSLIIMAVCVAFILGIVGYQIGRALYYLGY